MPATKPKDEIAWKDEAFDIPVPESSGGCTLCILIYTQDHISDDQLLGSVEVPVDEMDFHEPGLAPRARCFPVTNKQLSHREIAHARMSLAAEVMTPEHYLSQNPMGMGDSREDPPAPTGGDAVPCSQCGNAFAEGGDFCLQCGNRTGPLEAASQPAQAAAQTEGVSIADAGQDS